MRTLYVAAGGGGDAVGALLARRALGDTDQRPPLVTTYAWERLRIDPVPGPRARTDFTALAPVGDQPFEVTSGSDTAPPGRSVLPRLVESSGARIFLHDLDGGTIGLRDQLRHLARSLDVGELVVVDVGGDIVARGSEPGLRSPLADSLSLAAALGTGIPTTVMILGAGADAEVPEGEVKRLLEGAGGRPVGRVTSDDVHALAPVLSWHPTEATALVAAGAKGMRGFVAMRRGRDPVPVSDHTPEVWVVSQPTLDSFPLARMLQETTSLSEAEDVMRFAAVNEIDFERKVAAETPAERPRKPLPVVISDMAAMGATHITSRRLSETLCLRGLDEVESSGSTPTDGMWSRDDLVRIARSIEG
ncbi:DUF1152 domain-containing protein [Janibacter cremeus]|uniref:DUF1152 domain-containing protein n=1 Tax=Janibacter cremeus TaxID=1285192 RepID=UPI0023F7244C|nr:DUF1152 domain-containing protein [Janibacter cremeus]WEV77737.1 DUF1152 domain-containing protein [Janibacter cremeus]